MDGKITVRVLSGLVMIAAIAAIAFFAFNAGVAKGSPVMVQAPSGETMPAPYPYYGLPMYHHFGFGWGFGFLGLLVPLFFLFVAMRAFRFLFWGARWGHPMHRRGHWGAMGDREGVPPFFEEWHNRAHGEQAKKE